MNVLKTDEFIADLERQFEWEVGDTAGWEMLRGCFTVTAEVTRLGAIADCGRGFPN